MFVKQIRVESLGNSAYLVGSEEAKVCAVVDPLRDVDMYMREADALGVKITHALETHVHNDFISGSREVAARTGATVCASVAGARAVTAASILEREGFHDVSLVLGGAGSWQEAGYPMEKGAE